MHVESEEEARNLGCMREIGMQALTLFVNDSLSFGREYGEINDEERSKLLGLLLLGKALADNDGRVLELAIKRLAVGFFSDFTKRGLKKQPAIELGRELAKGLKRVEFVLWRKDTHKETLILPGLRCPDIHSALYTLAVLSLEGGTGLGACVICGTPFVQTRKTRKTCSGKCRYALHMKKKATHSAKRRKRR